MHVRFSSCIGMSVVEDGSDEALGILVSVLLHPDLGTVEGLFVKTGSFFQAETLFVSSLDILHWGTHVRVSDAQALSPLEDRVRLQAFMQEGRTILHQRITTEGGVFLGTCKDIQCNTKTFTLEWLFPRKFFRWGIPIPASAIVEVKPEAVIVREQAMGTVIAEAAPVLHTLEELAKTPAAGMVKSEG